MRQAKGKDYFRDLLLYWSGPHGDGSLRDGVDGYRIDHMMDDLDHKGRLTNLFADFWTPIFSAIRQRNPAVRIMAEQASWGWGDEWLTRGNTDMVFAFPLRGALAKLDKQEILDAIRGTQARTPPGKSQIVFLENHDIDRFASLHGSDPARLRIGAALNLTLKGEPLMYYGQELGMRGAVSTAPLNDSAHIPLREAFRWTRDLAGPGSAIWYERAGRPWWVNRYNRSDDGVSLDVEQADPGSLYHFYARLLALRNERPELRGGTQRILCDDSGPLICILREMDGGKTLVVANPGKDAAALPADAAAIAAQPGATTLLSHADGDSPATIPAGSVRIIGTR